MPLYTETQRMRQPWIVAIIGLVALFGWGAFVQQIVRGKPIGDDPMPDWALVLLTALIGVGLPAMLVFWRLKTEVYPDRVELDMRPLSHRTFAAAEIAGAAARTYRPIREFGGWGIRGLGSNRAYNMSGDQGVQLLLVNGNHILIGSQRPQELEAAIASIVGK